MQFWECSKKTLSESTFAGKLAMRQIPLLYSSTITLTCSSVKNKSYTLLILLIYWKRLPFMSVGKNDNMYCLSAQRLRPMVPFSVDAEKPSAPKSEIRSRLMNSLTKVLCFSASLWFSFRRKITSSPRDGNSVVMVSSYRRNIHYLQSKTCRYVRLEQPTNA